MTQTNARDWFEAKQRGERLPAHELPVDQLSGDLLCPVCGEPLELTSLRLAACAVCNATVEMPQ